MLFVPYRAQIKLHKFPTVTVLVMLICFFVYLAQYQNELAIEAHAAKSCQQLAANSDKGIEGDGYRFSRFGGSDFLISCAEIVTQIYLSPYPDKELGRWVKILHSWKMHPEAERVKNQYLEFLTNAPRKLNPKLWHERTRLDLAGMLTSTFAHGDWGHLIFNLIFFFAFAAAVEMVIGPVLFLGMVVALSFGIGFFDYGFAIMAGDPWPSLGLSGVVMGMLGLFAYLLPKARIRFFFWFMISVGTISLPGWMIMIWYMGWDLLSQLSKSFGSTNYIAHLSGGALGMLLGILLFHQKRHWSRSLILEDVDLNKDETWTTKINGLMAGTVVLGFSFLAAMFVIIFAILFVQHFWVQALMIAPVLVAGYQLYRQKHKPGDFECYQRGLKALDGRLYDEALKYLKPLADRNYARALCALGRLHLTANGALKDPSKAAEYLTRAATRGNAEAQYALGTLLIDGHGVPPNAAKGVEWYAKAANAGLPEAARSLAHLHENGPGIPIDMNKAIEWYGRAAEGFQKLGRREDAVTIIRLLDGLAPRNPEAQVWVDRLKTR